MGGLVADREGRTFRAGVVVLVVVVGLDRYAMGCGASAWAGSDRRAMGFGGDQGLSFRLRINEQGWIMVIRSRVHVGNPASSFRVWPKVGSSKQ